MKIPTVGWAFFALTVVVLTVYALNLGVFIGSDTKFKAGSNPYYSGECRYLYLTGVRSVWGGTTGKSPEEAAEDLFCPVFGNSQ